MRMVRRTNLAIFVAAPLLLPACAAVPRAQSVARERPADAQTLRARAERVWSARVAERWADAFDCEDPAERSQVSLADYERWNRESQPFVYRHYHIARVETDGPMGWVEVECATAMRRFPDVPPREAVRWEKWHVQDGQWFLLPIRLYEQYPDPPALRDQAAEGRLRARFDETWRARLARDWALLHAFIDPRSRSQWPLEELSKAEGLMEWRRCEVAWVEARGDAGRVRVQYETKRLDPSMSKMPPEKQELIERWVLVEGEWYRAVAGEPPTGS